jgi:hypothetical protein
VLLLLTPADREAYFPELPVPEEATAAALQLAQAEAEVLAGRPLCRSSFREDWVIPPLRTFYLSMHPIDLQTLKVTTEGRNDERVAVPSGAIEVDETGLVVVLDPDIRSARFEFESEPNLLAVKSAIAGILYYNNVQ